MGKFDGVLLVSDFDDTLYAGSCQIPERSLKALEYFISQGGRFTVATGRAHNTFTPYRHLVPINAPVVLSNGSLLYDYLEEKVIYQTFLPDSAPEDFRAVCEAFPDVGVEIYNGEDIYAYRPNRVTDFHMKKVGVSYTEVTSIDDIPQPWTKAIFQQENDRLLPVQPWMAQRFGDRYEIIFSNPIYLEITAKGSNKGGMVSRLAQLMEISPEHIYCAGDNQNDIPMLQISAIPFAPSDCSDHVKEMGARLLCPCEEGIMGDIIEILDTIYP